MPKKQRHSLITSDKVVRKKFKSFVLLLDSIGFIATFWQRVSIISVQLLSSSSPSVVFSDKDTIVNTQYIIVHDY